MIASWNRRSVRRSVRSKRSTRRPSRHFGARPALAAKEAAARIRGRDRYRAEVGSVAVELDGVDLGVLAFDQASKTPLLIDPNVGGLLRSAGEAVVGRLGAAHRVSADAGDLPTL